MSDLPPESNIPSWPSGPEENDLSEMIISALKSIPRSVLEAIGSGAQISSPSPSSSTVASFNHPTFQTSASESWSNTEESGLQSFCPSEDNALYEAMMSALNSIPISVLETIGSGSQSSSSSSLSSSSSSTLASHNHLTSQTPYHHRSPPHYNASETTDPPELPVQSPHVLKRKERPEDENTPPQSRKRGRTTGPLRRTPTLPLLTPLASGFALEVSSSSTPPSTSSGRRCLYNNCPAILHFPTEVKAHLMEAHKLTDRRNADPGGEKRICKWENCGNNNGVGFVNSVLRHVETHIIRYGCGYPGCPQEFTRRDAFSDHCQKTHFIPKGKTKTLERLVWAE